jgi:class 3 adenylate cyclase
VENRRLRRNVLYQDMEILVSRTVRDLVVGASIAVEDRGSHALKGIEGTWQLFAITRA